ncbi:MAG: transcriptional regulator TrmB [Candidatus Berkelbacteria bacterium Licking1014_2]|uniref:Transcriptional regulator TrmB n=1 Tax=Candidatus Berkelbacteria bacterium Licking1014_2 TaxID=2017146 RepID=A0A554LW59_9BACT|nr:MAG: transcriptional regulator TrmB [Candidatus Berkelbacteria bacterium Licking1014_2]
MDNNQLQKILTQIGLSEKEILIYLVCLEIGEASITPICKKVNLPRTTVYQILERLRDKKLIEIVQKNNRRAYFPLSLKNLLSFLKTKQSAMQEQIEIIKEIIPVLSSQYQFSSFQPRVRLFDGKDIRFIYEELLDLPINEVLYTGNSRKIIELLGKRWIKNFIRKRIDRKIKIKAIRDKTGEIDDPFYKPSKESLRSIRLSPEDFESPTHVLIYGNNVALMTTGEENFGLVITSKEFSLTMRNWFLQIWKISTEN